MFNYLLSKYSYMIIYDTHEFPLLNSADSSEFKWAQSRDLKSRKTDAIKLQMLLSNQRKHISFISYILMVIN